jgi:hypothetical protein
VVTKLERLYETAINETKPDSIYRKRLEFFKKNAFEPVFAAAREYHAATGAVPKYKVNELAVPPTKEGEISPDAWQKFTSMKMGDRITGKPVAESTKIKVAYDKQNLYVYAEMELPQAEVEPGKAKKDQDDKAEFQFGAGKDAKTGAMNLVNAKAKGRENPEVNMDDMFIIYLKPAAAEGYMELAINPNGSFTSCTDIIRKRGFFPTHELVKMDASNVKIISKLSGTGWLLSVEIPWKALPGVKEIPPEEMQTQFIRWNVKDKHRFHCWSPTLSSWDFPLSRFGWLVFKDVGKIETKVVRPDKLQIGYSSAIGPKPEQPKKINQAKNGEAIIVGQREIKENWIEFRGELIFPVTDIRTPQQIYRAILNITLVNVLGSEPYDAVVVDHIVPAEPDKISEKDYFASTIGDKPVGPILPKGFSRGKSMIKRILSLDVTNCVKDDISQGRKVSAYRLRTADGCTQADGDNHSLVFNGSPTGENGPALTLQLLAK